MSLSSASINLRYVLRKPTLTLKGVLDEIEVEIWKEINSERGMNS